MKAIISVIGEDRLGVIAKVSGKLFDMQINIEDISQTLMQNYFVMIMMTDVSESPQTIAQINARLKAVGEKIGLDVRVQHEDIFNCMHRI